MKKILFTIISCILLTAFCYAQSNSINYKAIIKDASGNVVASQPITVQFTILSNAVNVYQETHTPTTDANGIVILNIGTGTTSDIFTDIIWGTYDHTLNVQVDTGAGLIDLGTTSFSMVPYAHAAGNVSGLEKLTESSKTGWRITGSDSANYGTIGSNAMDLSISTTPSTTLGATGLGSVALGLVATASGSQSLAIGNTSEASGTFSSAIGFSTEASGNFATAIGNGSIASGSSAMALGDTNEAIGDYSLATGNHTTSEASHNVAFGRYNVGGGTVNSWEETEPLLEVGNGTNNSSRSNALTILKNGTIIAPTFDLIEITDDKALITKEYADTNLVGSGLENTFSTSYPRWRLIGVDPDNYGSLGVGAVDLSYTTNGDSTKGATGSRSFATGKGTTASGSSSTAMGDGTEASGQYSTALGNGTEASGRNSTALGTLSVASGATSTALGYDTRALGDYSFATGLRSIATGNYSFASGLSTKADSRYSTTFGRYNIGGGTASSWDPIDPLFEIGNGSDDANRSNALTILKNGTITAPTFDLIEITDDKALITKEYADTNLVGSGLESLDEGNGSGWSLKGRDPANYGDIGNQAVDLSHSSIVSTTYGSTGSSSFTAGSRATASGNYSIALGTLTEATGNYSTALGYSGLASGLGSTALGYRTTSSANYSTSMGFQSNASGNTATAIGNFAEAIGDQSIAMGSYTEASGNVATALGSNTRALGAYSTAMGYRTRADANNATSFGRYNIGGGDPINWTGTDPLFEIGNGVSSTNKSNAVTVLQNGTIIAPSFDLTEITDDKALITKEFFDTNTPSAASGLEALDEGNGLGWRLKGKDPANYGDIGNNAVDLSYNNSVSTTRGALGENSVAFGKNTIADGNTSTAMGFGAKASGYNATAGGSLSVASGDYSFAFGRNTDATSVGSVAFGRYTNANGPYSTALGDSTTASGFYSTAMGISSIASGYASFATGEFAIASGYASIATGVYTLATGDYSFASGTGTKAESHTSTTFGRFNIGGGDPMNWTPTEPLFEIGNGSTSGAPANALTVLKNGKVGIGEHQPIF